MSEREATFHLEQDGLQVASVTGPLMQAWNEIWHYAQVYGQDGPVSITGSVEDMEAVAQAQKERTP
jgi:hypothetical protein